MAAASEAEKEDASRRSKRPIDEEEDAAKKTRVDHDSIQQAVDEALAQGLQDEEDAKAAEITRIKKVQILGDPAEEEPGALQATPSQAMAAAAKIEAIIKKGKNGSSSSSSSSSAVSGGGAQRG